MPGNSFKKSRRLLCFGVVFSQFLKTEIKGILKYSPLGKRLRDPA